MLQWILDAAWEPEESKDIGTAFSILTALNEEGFRQLLFRPSSSGLDFSVSRNLSSLIRNVKEFSIGSDVVSSYLVALLEAEKEAVRRTKDTELANRIAPFLYEMGLPERQEVIRLMVEVLPGDWHSIRNTNIHMIGSACAQANLLVRAALPCKESILTALKNTLTPWTRASEPVLAREKKIAESGDKAQDPQPKDEDASQS